MNANAEAVAALIAAPAFQEVLASLRREDLTMLLYAHETERAMEIKQAVEAREDLKNLSDYEYVHYAICTRGETMEQILYRASMMQAFREEYKIKDTVEEGVELFDRLTRVDQPGFMVAMEYLPSSHNFMSVTAWSNLFPDNCKTHEQYRVFLGCMYYKYQAKFNQFCAIREGSTSLVECMDTGLSNCRIEFFEKFMHELFRWYPVNPKEMFFVNSPGCVNFVMGMWQKWMKADLRGSIILGHQVPGLEGERVDRLYKSPTPEAARQHMLSRVAAFLTNRYKNEKEFRLPSLTPNTNDDGNANA